MQPNHQHTLQAIWGFGLMESWFCTWDDLLRLLAVARVAKMNNGINLETNLL